MWTDLAGRSRTKILVFGVVLFIESNYSKFSSSRFGSNISLLEIVLFTEIDYRERLITFWNLKIGIFGDGML